MNVVKDAGFHVPVSLELLDDVRAVDNAMAEAFAHAANELMTDLIVGPRYGPPAPRIETPEERCEHCGHLLDEGDWDY